MDVREKLVEQCEDLGTLPCCATYPKNNHYNWQNGIDVFNWWVGIDENQMKLDESLKEGDFDGT